MRVGSYAVARPDYFDRVPLEVNAGFGGGALVPHANTERWTYTVPSSRKTYVDVASVQTVQETAATVAGLVNHRIGQTPSGGAEVNLISAAYFGVAVDSNVRIQLGGTILMLAGAGLHALTSDAHPDGTTRMTNGFHGIEFAA